MPAPTFKQPVSVLVVIHTPSLQVLLLRRVRPSDFWQSVTGSLEPDETPRQAALREVGEETGIAAQAKQLVDWQRTYQFAIHAEWRARYAQDVTHNTEHVFSLCVPEGQPVRLAPDEHDALLWLPFDEAAARVFSWTNREAILELPSRERRR
ncbi:MAG TPA: dihydroneopterin triphosphate diphosphatase [Aromatoleum sp.]|uniref:dihydroneopterin triphosphate diphosphatase n=1 Tax=Aromatoleum sp. TaxID=2307007 RepID=UPI002B4A9B1D|nr:dihydroneopterin triphosphate diphosphatase [Aromatoleum sp.]HJV28316.1 dihydroneopterin triphosphate diphosphatase [Aromatoleum sp.]